MDRTNEFFALVDSLSATEHQDEKLKAKIQKPKNLPSKDLLDFTSNSQQISALIVACNKKMLKLDDVSKNTGIFDVGNSEVTLNSLSNLIENDLMDIGKRMNSISDILKNKNSQLNEQTRGHCLEIVEYLNSKNLEFKKKFKKIMKTRAESLRNQSVRRDFLVNNNADFQFNSRKSNESKFPNSSYSSSKPTSFASSSPSASSTSLKQRNNNRLNDDYFGSFDDNNPLGLENQDLQPLVQERVERQKTSAWESISRKLNELGDMFTDLNRMLAHQREDLITIEDNIDLTNLNMDESIGYLDKARRKFKSHRSLICKVFVAIAVFLLLVGLFLR